MKRPSPGLRVRDKEQGAENIFSAPLLEETAMNGVHDLGGMHNIGPIDIEKNEPVFHEDWERRAFGLLMATFGGGFYNLDEIRHGIERMPPAEYLTSNYYEHWIHGVETVLKEKGLITQKELDDRLAKLAKGGA
jgi:hypothetical protein